MVLHDAQSNARLALARVGPVVAGGRVVVREHLEEPGLRREIGYRVLSAGGAVVFAIPSHRAAILRLWRPHLAGAWVCVGVVLVALAFTWWARIHLGNMWSGRVAKKSDHRLVDSGPYGLVRHPIDTGLLAATLATAGAKGTLLGVIGASLIVLGVWWKASVEEDFLRQELGPAYDSYRRRVPMFLPFGPTARR